MHTDVPAFVSLLERRIRTLWRMISSTGHAAGGFFRRHSEAFAMAVILLGIGVAQIKTVTYASGTDAMTYVRAANDILAGDWPGDAGLPYAPGFPAILACAVALAGPFAPYWVNCLLLAAAIFVLMKTLGVMLKNPRLAALGALCVFCGLAGLYGNALHFLLMPFRETASLLFVALAHYTLIYACQVAWRPWLLVASGFCALLSAGVREPSILAFVGPVAYLCARPGIAWRRRIGQVFLFFAPFILAVALVLLSTQGRQALMNQQAHKWFHFIFTEGGMQSLLARWDEHGTKSWGFLLFMVSRFGIMTFILGIICAVWSRLGTMLLFHALTAVLLFFFYAHMEAHPRYMLSVQWFMLPVMVYGVVVCCLQAWRFARNGKGNSAPVCATLTLVCICWLSHELPKLTAWGTKTTAAQIGDFRKLAAQLPPDIDTVAVTSYSRYAADATLSFTRLNLVDASGLRGHLLTDRSYGILSPLNASAHFIGGYSEYRGLSAKQILDHYADVYPLPIPGGSPVFSIGTSRYEFLLSRPWSERTNDTIFSPQLLVGGFIWFDFRDTRADARHEIQLLDEAGLQIERFDGVLGDGMVPLYLSPAQQQQVHRVRTVSTHPLPKQLLVVPGNPIHPDYWAFDESRRLSLKKWLPQPSFRGGWGDRWGGGFVSEGSFRIPVPPNLPRDDLMISIILEPRFNRKESVTFTYTPTNQPALQFTNRLSSQRIRHHFNLRGFYEDSHISLSVKADPVSRDNHYRLVALAVRSRSALPSDTGDKQGK
jgi:hypothetical protein